MVEVGAITTDSGSQPTLRAADQLRLQLVELVGVVDQTVRLLETAAHDEHVTQPWPGYDPGEAVLVERLAAISVLRERMERAEANVAALCQEAHPD